jgi:ActR/RegA family two-component response regulator
MARRVLLVDDEASIRETLPRILQLHGFDVTAAGTVSEALAEIARQPFDILISDLNVGQPGDGFTVVSAMRRTHPDCVTFILTGYPDFQTALQAIRSQVDDYIVKPARISELVGLVERTLAEADRRPRHHPATKRIHQIVSENIAAIEERTLAAMKVEPEMAALELTDEQRVFPLKPLLEDIVRMCAAGEADPPEGPKLFSAAIGGHVRRMQGYSIPMLVATLRLLENTVYQIVDENLLALDVSYLVRDLRQFHNCLSLQLEKTIRAFLETRERRLLFESSERWTGWYCERCCWSLHAPPSESERQAAAAAVGMLFEAHNCEEFARATWRDWRDGG